MYLSVVAIPLVLGLSVVAQDPYLVHVGNSRFELGATVPSDVTPEGSFSYVPIIGGSINFTATNNTPALSTRVIPGGNDNALVRTDGSIGIDVFVAAQDTQPPHDLYTIRSPGYVPPGFDINGTFTTGFGAMNAYQIPRINTASKEHAWLNAVALVGQESIEVVNGTVRAIELRIFQVVVKTL